MLHLLCYTVFTLSVFFINCTSKSWCKGKSFLLLLKCICKGKNIFYSITFSYISLATFLNTFLCNSSSVRFVITILLHLWGKSWKVLPCLSNRGVHTQNMESLVCRNEALRKSFLLSSSPLGEAKKNGEKNEDGEAERTWIWQMECPCSLKH